MLSQFYSYLSGKIIEFFNVNKLVVGSKYNVQFETEEQVRSLFEKLRLNTLVEPFYYKDEKGDPKYEAYTLTFNNVKLIVSATIDNVQPDFLTRLRNMVGAEPGYEDKAILFIHNTTLDSIIGGTESFSKEGMPFNTNSIQADIKKKLSDSDFSDVDKEIIKLDLERKNNSLFQDSSSIFEYKELLNTMNGTCIEKYQYKDFGLFPDSQLEGLTGKELKNRLKKNAEYFSKVDEIHNYGNPETQLERYFDPTGIDDLKKSDWKDVDFKDVNKSADILKTKKPLEYLGCNHLWDKEEGTSKAKSRIRNIIIFNRHNEETIDLDLSFDDFLKKESLIIEGDLEASISGKKIKVKLKNVDGVADFYKIKYTSDNNEKFEFKILMVDFHEKYIDNIKTKYSVVIKPKIKYLTINTNENEIVINEFEEQKVEKEVLSNDQTIDIEDNEKTLIRISDTFEMDEDKDVMLFNLNINKMILPVGVKGISEKIAPIEGIKVWKLKREKKFDFKSADGNKLEHGTKEYFARDEFKRNLELEKMIIELGGKYFKEYDSGLKVIDLEFDIDVEKSFNCIIEYYRISNKLPSLTYINDELKYLYNSFIKNYIIALNNIDEGVGLTTKQRNLFKLGTIKREVGDREQLFTPLHPINIAYQLLILNEVEDEELLDDIAKKLTSTYLLPYLMDEDGALFIPMEQFHSPEWKYYVDEKLPRYKSSRDFVRKLVCEKIEEFIGHFKYLFIMGNNAPLKMNLINTGDSKEILQGIFEFYIKQLKNSKGIDEVMIPIDICIYSDRNITNAFEEVAFNEDIANIKEVYGLDFNVDNMSEEDVLNLYREKVHFYSKNIDNGVEYAHVTFLEMDNEVKAITSNMHEIPSGVILKGLVSGVPSVFLGDSYRTGFGTKFINTDNDLLVIAKKLNSINAVISGEPFNSEYCKAISVPNKSKEKLDRIYNSSHWVTFIDPKVDLNFFKNDPEAKDLLIIHYSDQYTTAGGYDAITVTRKSTPYQRVIEDFLTKNNVDNVKEFSPKIINMFNAINGDWLLRLLSSKSHFPREKISILSAIKLALAYFKNDNITWVPISLEEILRVSGGAGLKKSEGFLSAKNLGFEKNGATSDDILLVGIEEKDNDLFVHYYPIEVKIGINNSDYINKAIEQAKSTKKIFNETLLPKADKELTYIQKVYRNFLMQLVITSAEKLKLYGVGKAENWDKITSSDIRRRLLNEEYEINDDLKKYIGEAAVVSFKKCIGFRDFRMQEDVSIVEFTEEDGINYITRELNEVTDYLNECNEINKDNLLCNLYKYIDDNQFVADPSSSGYASVGNSSNNITIDGGKVSTSGDDDNPNVVATLKEERDMKILFGFNQATQKEIYWYPNDTNKLMHTNTGIIGTMGTGKTQFTKSVITQIHREAKHNIDGKDIGILIFDYKGDYNKKKIDFVEATDAKVFKLFNLPFNPFSISITEDPMPMLPYHIASTFAETIVKAFGLGKKQEALLGDLIIEAYENRGILSHDEETWTNLAPTIKDVYNIYEAREDIKKDDSLYAAFRKLVMFKVFEEDPQKTQGLFELIDGVTVIDLSGYDPSTQNLVVAITLDLFYSQMQVYGHSKINGSKRQLNKIILVDEADNFLSKGFESLKKILKEGREFGVGTILSTQLLSHFSSGDTDYADYILTWIVHNVADLNAKDVKYIFNTQNKQDEEVLYNKIKSLGKHYSLVKMGGSDKPIYMKDKAFWELIK
ncbi:MAG: DNA phosphorothioation-dependent restriction protein DptH [Clostridiaceae bacterium]